MLIYVFQGSSESQQGGGPGHNFINALLNLIGGSGGNDDGNDDGNNLAPYF
jgi:hypothetical protein